MDEAPPASKRQCAAAMTIVLYPERRYPNDWIEREVLGRKAEIRICAVAALAGLSAAERAGVTHLVLHGMDATAADLAAFPDLRLVLRTGPAAIEGRFVDVTGHDIAERADHAMALALALHRGVWDARVKLRRSAGLYFGILGLGRVGMAVALRARAFGFRVLFHDPHAAPGVEAGLGIERARRLQGVLLKADILSIHEPEGDTLLEAGGLPEAGGRLGLADLAVLPQGALVVDITGGAMLDRAALAGMLEAGHLGGAALDLPAGVAAPPGVLVTRCGTTDAAVEALRRLTAEAILSAP